MLAMPRAIPLLVFLFAGLSSGNARGEDDSGIVYFSNRERSWDRTPSVTILTKENDRRIRLVFEAVEFWNRTFAEIGSPFRLGPVEQTGETLLAQFLATMSDAVLSRQPPTWSPSR